MVASESIPLLSPKFHIPPPRLELVSRSRLIERLDKGIQRKLTLISAPAGYGKSTLMSTWVHNRDRTKACPRIAWLSLDKADNDPARFWVYSIAALQMVWEGLGTGAQAALQSPQPPAIEMQLTSLINEIADRGPEPVVLVFDDFHLITTEPILDAMLFLVDHLPPCLHLVIAGRADPPWPLARLRASGEMTELRTADLRFTAAEVTTFLNDTIGLGLSAADITALEERTEGWIVGLQMAALSMQGRHDIPAFIRTFYGSHRFILDYLVEEVLERQPPYIRDFLHQTAVLERMNASLCNALTERQDSQTILASLEQANLFLVSLDDERCWYRYHHLFADLLRSRLGCSQPDLIAALHRRACQWYKGQRLVVEAVTHALAAGDAEHAARLVEQNMLEMIEHGHLRTLIEWLNALPGELARSRPWLSIARALALAYTGSFDEVSPCLQNAARALDAGDEQALVPGEIAHINGHIHAIRCYVMNVKGEDCRLAIELAQTALAQLPESDLRMRGRVEVLLGSAYRNNMDYAAAHETLTSALAINKAAEQKFVVIDVLCQIARVESDQGRLRQAAATCREALRLANEYGISGLSQLPAASSALITLSGILYEWNELSAAHDHAQQALALARQWGAVDNLAGGYVSLIMIQITSKEFDRAFESIQEMKQLYGIPGPFPRRPVALEALMRLAMNDMAGAMQCASELIPHTDERWRMSILIPLYIAQFRQGSRASLDDVLDYLVDSLQKSEAAGSLIGIAQGFAWQAMALEALGRIDEANSALARALSMAESEGYVRMFLDGGAPMRKLLASVIEADRKLWDESAQRRVDYAGLLLSALSEKVPAGRLGIPSTTALIEPLSDREMDVLRLLNTALPTPEIAQELFLSTNTIRSHVKSIYGKLNAHGRTEAIQRAKELGLLP